MVKHSINHILGMAGPIDMKQKGSALVGHWVNYMTLTFDLGFFKVALDFSRSYFRTAASQELLIWLMWNEKEANQLDIGPICGQSLK